MMRKLTLTGIALLAFSAVAWRSGADATSPAAGASFALDPVHSAIAFRIKYAGMSDFYGRFDECSGSFVVDESDLSKSKFDITVKAASVHSGNDRRDGHLRSPDFLSAKQHADIRFISKTVQASGKNKLRVTGDLTLRGVTKEVVAEGTYGGQKAGGRGGLRAGFSASFTFRREDFGITFGAGTLGSEVTILMGLTGLKK